MPHVDVQADEGIVYFMDGVPVSLQTYTYDNPQVSFTLTNTGTRRLIWSVGDFTDIYVSPGESVTKDMPTTVSSFSLRAEYGYQSFSMRSAEVSIEFPSIAGAYELIKTKAEQSALDTTNQTVTDLNDQINQIKGTNANAEVQAARGTFPLLGDRLANVDASLADKVTQAEVTNSLKNSEKLVIAVATGESNNYAGIGYANMNKPNSLLSGDGTRNSAWFGSLSVKPSVNVQLPFGVVVGDSIAEGHPALHGRLHANGTNTYDPSVVNQSGQLAYEFGQITGLYWYNQGIGGQVSSQIWGRWNRDVLGQVYSGYNDGLGSQTLPRKPYAVFINIGINDIAQNKDIENETKVNMVNMAKSARDNGILCIFNNVGAWSDATAAQVQTIQSLNTWMASTLPKYGAYVADYYSWSEDPAQPGSGKINAAFYADHTHPSKPGYKALARYILNQLNGVPLYFRGVVVETPIDPDYTPSSYSRPKSVSLTLEGVTTDTVCENKESAFLTVKSTGTDNVLTFKVNNGYTITGTNYTGISKIKAVISSLPQPFSGTNSTSVRVSNSADISIPSGAWTLLTFDTERFDNGNSHDITANTSRLICNEPGTYLIAANVLFYANATGVRALKLLLNGSKVIGQLFIPAATGLGTHLSIGTIYNLAAGDYVEIQVYHNSGVAMPVQTSAESSPEFMMVKVAG
jgi:lysophospholipase L1-like esterase